MLIVSSILRQLAFLFLLDPIKILLIFNVFSYSIILYPIIIGLVQTTPSLSLEFGCSLWYYYIVVYPDLSGLLFRPTFRAMTQLYLLAAHRVFWHQCTTDWGTERRPTSHVNRMAARHDVGRRRRSEHLQNYVCSSHVKIKIIRKWPLLTAISGSDFFSISNILSG